MIGFFKRLIGLESKDEKLQRQLNEQKQKIIKILKNDGRASEELLTKIENDLFDSETILNMINDILQTKTLNQDAQNELKATKQETVQIIAENTSNPIPTSDNNGSPDVQTEESAEPKSNAELLNELTGNLSSLATEIAKNNNQIANMENTLKILQSETADINQLIEELEIRLSNSTDDEERQNILDQIQELKAHRENLRLSTQNIKQKIIQIQQLVAQQSKYLANYQQGSGKKDSLKKINKMSRSDLDKMAKSLHLDPTKYRTKKDIQDVIKLMMLAKQLPLQKLDKKRLSILAKNYDIPVTNKKVMVAGLKKYKLIR